MSYVLIGLSGIAALNAMAALWYFAKYRNEQRKESDRKAETSEATLAVSTKADKDLEALHAENEKKLADIMSVDSNDGVDLK